MQRPGLVSVLALLSLVLPAQARPSIECNGVSSYSNCVPHLSVRLVKPKPNKVRALPQVHQTIYNYSDSAHQKLENRVVTYSAWNGSEWTPAQLQLNQLIEEQARQVDLDPLIIEIIVKHESAFNPSATSGVGAQGLMQLMPETAADLGCRNAYDPSENVAAGTRYFADLYRQYGDLGLALAAYNAGPGNVASYGGIPPIAETQNYVASIGGEYLSRRRKRTS